MKGYEIIIQVSFDNIPVNSLLIFSSALAQTSNINSVTSPTTVNLNAVAVVNNLTVTNTNNDLTKLDAWAVGESGTIVHWNGNTWATVSSPITDNLYSVVFTNATNGWAVGGSSSKGVILYYNGTWNVWTRISFSGYTDKFDTINTTLYSVTVSSDGMVGWIVGAEGITLVEW